MSDSQDISDKRLRVRYFRSPVSSVRSAEYVAEVIVTEDKDEGEGGALHGTLVVED